MWSLEAEWGGRSSARVASPHVSLAQATGFFCPFSLTGEGRVGCRLGGGANRGILGEGRDGVTSFTRSGTQTNAGAGTVMLLFVLWLGGERGLPLDGMKEGKTMVLCSFVGGFKFEP